MNVLLYLSGLLKLLLFRSGKYSLLLISVITYAGDLQASEPVIIDSETLVQLVVNNPDVVIVDVRTRREYVNGHLHGAKNFSLSKYLLAEFVPDKSTPIIFYCGGKNPLRSKIAVNKTIGYGYENVYWFKGGLQEWVFKAMPISFI